jgi:hypothetical protein
VTGASRWSQRNALTGTEEAPTVGRRSNPWAGTRRKIPASPKIVSDTATRASRQMAHWIAQRRPTCRRFKRRGLRMKGLCSPENAQ